MKAEYFYLASEYQWSPGAVQELLENHTQVGVGSIHGKRDGNIWTRASSGTEERRFLALLKTESNTGDQERGSQGLLRVSVRGAKNRAIPPRNFL